MQNQATAFDLSFCDIFATQKVPFSKISDEFIACDFWFGLLPPIKNPGYASGSEIRKSPNIEPLLLRIERSHLIWFGHVSRMPQERLPKQALLAKPNGRKLVGRPRTRWTNYIVDLGWTRLGLQPSEIIDAMEDREVWRLNLKLLPPQPSQKSGENKKKEDNIPDMFFPVLAVAEGSIIECQVKLKLYYFNQE